MMKFQMLKTAGALSLLVGATLFSSVLMAAQSSSDTERQARLAQPGPEHKRLDMFAGSWQMTGQCWGKAGDNPESVTGSENAEWVLGNRFVKYHTMATKGDKPFEAIGMLGYDNAERQFVASCQDTECTGIKLETGTYDPATKTFTYTGEFKDENGQMIRCRRVLRIDNNDQHTMTAYLTQSGGSETKVAEVTFSRTSAKAAPKR
jgi:hypothetical protein